MPSAFTWLDNRPEDAQRVREALKALEQSGTVDPLGIGSIRDAFAEALFPGLSTVKTRARYFFFVPWVFQEVDRLSRSPREALDRARDLEVRLIYALLAGSTRVDGVIGQNSRDRTKQLPSTVYWGGLGRLGIRRVSWSRQDYFASVGSPRPTSPWIPSLSQIAPPSDWLESTSLDMTPAEAEFLGDRILTSSAMSLLGVLVRDGVDGSEVELPWDHPSVDSAPLVVREHVHHARLFAVVLWGSGLLYNLELERLRSIDHPGYTPSSNLEADYEIWLDWIAELTDDLAAWDLDAMWRTVRTFAGSVDQSFRFVNWWIETVRAAGDADPDSADIRRQLRNQELAVKGTRPSSRIGVLVNSPSASPVRHCSRTAGRPRPRCSATWRPRAEPMLSPHDRVSLFDALRPPPGFHFEAGVGTSFSLSLETLLTAPIAFALFDISETEFDGPSNEPVGLLESIRRYARHLTVFCQAGQIALPRSRRSVYAWFEEAIVETVAARPHRLFHPKVWLCRYRSNSDSTAVLRVLVATRNLTLDASMDTVLQLDTAAYADRGQPVPSQAPLAAFFEGLVASSPRLTAERAEEILDLVTEVSTVPLTPPAPFTAVAFHVLGNGGRPPFPSVSERSVVIVPFVGQTFLSDFVGAHEVSLLLSREATLDRIDPEVLHRCSRVAVLHPNVGFERPDEDEADPTVVERESAPPNSPLGGLHAKLFAFDAGSSTHIFTGSANATAAAFDGNIEVVAELVGPRSEGIEALLADTPDEVGFDDLCIDYESPAEAVAVDTELESSAYQLDWIRHEIGECAFEVFVRELSDGGYMMSLRTDAALPEHDMVDIVTVWPISLLEDQSGVAIRLGAKVNVDFTVSFEGLTSFFGVRLVARVGDTPLESAFVVNALMSGVDPEQRQSMLLASMLRDPDRLLRYLMLLLSDPTDGADEAGDGGAEILTGGWGSSWDEVPLLELFVKAAAHRPERLDHINALLTDLGEHRSRTVPAGFDDIWDAVWAHRVGSRRA